MAKPLIREPVFNKRCTACQEETNWHRTPERGKLKLCAECYEVHQMQARGHGNKLLECMTCDMRAIVKASHLNCKPCRIQRQMAEGKR